MRARIIPGGRIEGDVSVPGDKSIAHRWLILAATADGPSRLDGLPRSLDVRSTAFCLAALTHRARPELEVWAVNNLPREQPHGSTWNDDGPVHPPSSLEVEGEGWERLVPSGRPLDCGNSGTSMRLLAGVAAGASFRTVLVGDRSLAGRPMERVARPLRFMGANVTTADGHAPVTIDGGPLHGIDYAVPVASAQVKTAVLLAGVVATGVTRVREPAPTRDHTERALRALGGPVTVGGSTISISAFQQEGFQARCPGDPSSSAFLVAAAALSGSELLIRGVGLNRSRTQFLEVMRRMGVRVETRIDLHELGEPVGDLWVAPCSGIEATRVGVDELPLVIDEVPVLAAMAAHAGGETRFIDGSELRLKESDRLAGLAKGIRALGGGASADGDDLVVTGGGLSGGAAEALGDHRLAMAFAVAALAARAPSEVEGMEAAEVSFPGFVPTLRRIGAAIDMVR